MKNLWKILGLSILLTTSSFALSACGDDDDGQDEAPDIFYELEKILDEVDKATKAEDVIKGLNIYDVKKQNDLKVACEEYGEIRSAKGTKDWKGVVDNNRNGAYYLATYIHIYNLDKKISKMEGSEIALTKFRTLFSQYEGCRTLLDDANDAAKNRR